MKKRFCCVPALVLACILAGCTAVFPSHAGDAAASPANALHTLEHGDENGCYTLCSDAPEAQPLLGYADYNSLTAGPLCSRAGCEHTASNCNARFSADETPQDVWILDKDHILIFTFASDETAALYLAARDGSERQELFRCAIRSCSISLDNPLLTDGEFVYLVCDFGAWKTVLCRISLETGQLEKLYQLAYLQKVLGVMDGRVLLLSFDLDAIEGFSQKPSAMEGMNDDSAWKKPDGVQGNRWLRLLDVYGSRHGCLDQWQADTTMQEREFALDGSRVWWLDGTGALGFADADGSHGTLEVQWPDAVFQPEGTAVFEDLQLVQENLVVTHLTGVTTGQPLHTRYAIDPASGRVWEIPLYYVNNSLRVPIEVPAGNSRALFARIYTNTREKKQIGSYGIPVTYYAESGRCGLILREDFLSGKPQYREFKCDYTLHIFE